MASASFQSTSLRRRYMMAAEPEVATITNKLVVAASWKSVPSARRIGTYNTPPPWPTMEKMVDTVRTAAMAMTKKPMDTFHLPPRVLPVLLVPLPLHLF